MKPPFRHGSPMVTSIALGFVTMVAILAAGCDRVDQKKFDAVYRAGKALEVDMSTGLVHISESEKLVKQLKTEISVLDGRTNGNREADAVRAYGDAADAYGHFLDVRSMDMRGDSRDGRLLVGDGWVPVASKYHLAIEAHADNSPAAKYNFYWMDFHEAFAAFSAATKKGLTDGSRLVNGKS